MDTTVLLWLLGTIIGVQTIVLAGLTAAFLSHLKDCGNYRVSTAALLGEIKSNLSRVQRDIGDHDTGLRGQVHKLSSDITPYILRRQKERGE